jgi:thioredoxin-like negative regulator of GroEL
MRYLMITAMALLFVGTTAFAQRGPAAERPGADRQAEKESDKEGEEGAQTGIQWITDSAKAMKLAKEQGKKLFVVWGTDWCGPCRALHARVWSHDSIAERVDKDFIPLLLDGDVDQEEKKMFPVRAYPTIILAEADGTILVNQRGSGGMMTPERWIAWIDQQIKGVDTIGEILGEAEEAEGLDDLLRIAEQLVKLGRHQEAADLYARAQKKIEKQLFEVKVERAELLLRVREDTDELRAIMDDILPTMFETKDERTQGLVYQYSNLIARLAPADRRDPAHARVLMVQLIETFPEHEYFRSFRQFAAMYAHLAGDNETALKEMRAMIKEDEEAGQDDTHTARARQFVERLEAGERYR